MTNLMLALYGDFKKLMKLLIAAVIIMSCVFAYADKQNMARIKAEAHSEQSPAWYVSQ